MLSEGDVCSELFVAYGALIGTISHVRAGVTLSFPIVGGGVSTASTKDLHF